MQYALRGKVFRIVAHSTPLMSAVAWPAWARVNSQTFYIRFLGLPCYTLHISINTILFGLRYSYCYFSGAQQADTL